MSQGESQLANEVSNDGSDEAAMSLLANLREREEEQTEGQAAEEGAEAEGADSEQEEVEGGEPEEQEESEPEFEVKIDGKTHKVKQSELIAGYQMQSDYQRKTAELAELRRKADSEIQQVQAERKERANRLDVLIDGLHRQLVGDSAALQELIETDPQAYLREQHKMQLRVQQLNEAMQHRQAIQGQMTQEEQRQHDEWAKAEREALELALPEWKDTKKATAEQRVIAEYLIERGYSKEELNTLQDHRALLIARDAALYRAGLKAKEKQTKPEPPKTVKPGAQVDPKHNNKQREQADALRAAKKSQSDDDWLRVLQTRR